MLVRIVKLSLQEDKIEEFLSNFNKQKEHIRHFPGCQFLELYNDTHTKNVFFTYSYWDHEEALNNYRYSKHTHICTHFHVYIYTKT